MLQALSALNCTAAGNTDRSAVLPAHIGNIVIHVFKLFSLDNNIILDKLVLPIKVCIMQWQPLALSSLTMSGKVIKKSESFKYVNPGIGGHWPGSPWVVSQCNYSCC